MAKLVKLDPHYWLQGGYGHWCPGCKGGHEINVDRPNSSGAKWTFNGDLLRPTFSPSVNIRLRPTFSPSVNIRWGRYADPKFVSPENHDPSGVCHYFIRDGRIQFCSDSTHALSGQTVDLPEIPHGSYVTSQRL